MYAKVLKKSEEQLIPELKFRKITKEAYRPYKQTLDSAGWTLRW